MLKRELSTHLLVMSHSSVQEKKVEYRVRSLGLTGRVVILVVEMGTVTPWHSQWGRKPYDTSGVMEVYEREKRIDDEDWRIFKSAQKGRVTGVQGKTF